MPKDDGGILDPHNVMEVNRSPMQRPGMDKLLRTAVVGGPNQGGDRRCYLSTRLLSQLLEVSRSSIMQRVVVDGAGVRVDLYVDPSGHKYEVWTLVGAKPRPEPLPAGLPGVS